MANRQQLERLRADVGAWNTWRVNHPKDVIELSHANLIGANLGWTSFGDRDLREIKGLETIEHKGPSPLRINTIYQSEGNIPEVFVRGTGAPDSFIEYMHALVRTPSSSPVPKLCIQATPGTKGPKQYERYHTWPALSSVTVRGHHTPQEDSPDEIGQAIADWLRQIRA